jgi:hypothetical protein
MFSEKDVLRCFLKIFKNNSKDLTLFVSFVPSQWAIVQLLWISKI